MVPIGRPWIVHLTLAFALAISVFALYWGSLDVGFVGDDYYFLDGSDSIEKAGKSFVGDWFWHDQDIGHARYYRPLQIVLTYIEYCWLWGDHPWGYHLDLLLIHIATSLLIVPLVLFVGGRNGGRYLTIAAWLAAFLFAWHPRHAEPVCMLNARSDSFCGLFLLASFAAYLRWRRSGGWMMQWVSLLTFVCALLCKEIAIILPFVIAVYELTAFFEARRRNRSHPIRASILATIPHFIILILVFGVIRTWALGGYVIGRSSYLFDAKPLQVYLIAVCKTALVLILPFESAIEAIYSTFFKSFDTFSYVGWPIIVLVILAFTVTAIRGVRLWSVGLGLCVAGSIPVLSELSDLHTTLSDRYLYVPSIGAAMVVADCIYRLLKAPSAVRYAVYVLLIGWLVASVPQTRLYIHQWQISSNTAESIYDQLKQLDSQYPPGNQFCIVSLPSLYQGKPILNTGLGRYWNHQLNRDNKPMRLTVPFLFLNMQTSWDKVTTDSVIKNNRLIHSVQGGNFFSFYQDDFAGIRLMIGTFSYGIRQVEFTLGEVFDSVIFFDWKQGKLTPISIQRTPFDNEIVAGTGPGGDGWLERYTMGTTPRQMGSHCVLTAGMIEKTSHDPSRGVHLSCGDVDNDGNEDIAVSFGPTSDPAIEFPSTVIVWNERDDLPPLIIGHPFSAFPRQHSRSIANTNGEIYTAIGRLIPGREKNQIACAQGLGGNQVIRIFEYTGREAPDAFQIAAQLKAFDTEQLDPEWDGSISLSSGDLDGDSTDELLVGPARNTASDLLFQIVKLSEINDSDGLAHFRMNTFTIPHFDPPIRNSQGSFTHAIGDVDGDGQNEILIASQGGTTRNGENLHSRVGVLRLKGNNQSLDGITFNPAGSLDVFSIEQNPSGAVTLTCGNLDRDLADEVVVGNGCASDYFSHGYDSASTNAPQHKIKAFDLVFDTNGNLTEILNLFPNNDGIYTPFTTDLNHDGRSIEVAIREL